MKKIVLIICYFGKLPNYFNLFLKSAGKNKSFVFLFVSDCSGQIQADIPSNFHFITMRFDEIVSLIKNRLNQKFVCHKPYKLCDYKPAYGLLFSEWIKEYDYWGHCDIDIIFGDIGEFVYKLTNLNYDKIFAAGHLSLYKNDDIINHAFKMNFSGINYAYAFSHKHSFGFDEMKGMNILFREKGLYYFDGRGGRGVEGQEHALGVLIPMRVLSPFSKPRPSKKIEFINVKNYKHQAVVWDNGKLFRYYLDDINTLKKEEYAYIHLQKRSFRDNAVKSNKFIILPNQFLDISNIGTSMFTQYDFNPKIQIKHSLPSLYRLHSCIFKLTRKKWER
jgi:hypothetical protein